MKQIEVCLLPFLLPVFREGNLHVYCFVILRKGHNPEYHSLQRLSIPNITQSIRMHYADAMQAKLKIVCIATAVFQRIKSP